LVETYGRSAAKKADRYVNVVIEPKQAKNKVRRPNHLVFERIR
jgi:hypothetical protein